MFVLQEFVGVIVDISSVYGCERQQSLCGHQFQQKDAPPQRPATPVHCLPHARQVPVYPGWRDYMEDASIHINNFPVNNHYLFGIFDGHGGPEVAQYCEKHFSTELFLNQKFKQKLYELALSQTFNKMDYLMQTEIGHKEISSLIEYNVSVNNRCDLMYDEYGGCTANICFVTDTDIIVANAGDSRCVACLEGKAMPLSFDHKPEDRNQTKRIKQAGGYVTKGRVNETLNVSRSIGDLEYKRNKNLKASEQIVTSSPDVVKIKRKGVEFIIMGCDGIWQRKSNEVMVEWISARLEKMVPPSQILEELFDDEVADNGDEYYGTDNMSAILIVFKH